MTDEFRFFFEPSSNVPKAVICTESPPTTNVGVGGVTTRVTRIGSTKKPSQAQVVASRSDKVTNRNARTLLRFAGISLPSNIAHRVDNLVQTEVPSSVG